MRMEMEKRDNKQKGNRGKRLNIRERENGDRCRYKSNNIKTPILIVLKM